MIVPARNEAERLGPCLDGLLDDESIGEIIVIDDQSDDGTVEVAAARGVRILRGGPPPAGWIGKPWALQQAVLEARGPWIVTLDADTRPRRGLVAGLVAAARAHRYDLLTVGGRYECGSFIEQALHASMLASLVYRFGPPGATHPPRVGRVLANGQCTVFRRDDLLADGGFAAAAGHFADDVALARHLAARGRRVGMLEAADLLTVDMHDGVGSVWREWGRTLVVDVGPTRVAVQDLLTWSLTTVLPGVRLAANRPSRLDAALLMLRASLAVGLRSAYFPPRGGLLLSPVADTVVSMRLLTSIARPARGWRGRAYARTPFRTKPLHTTR